MLRIFFVNLQRKNKKTSMRTSISHTFNKQQIANIVDTMTREEMAWTIKLLTDKMLLVSTPAVGDATPSRPSWWNRSLTAATQAMMPKERVDLGGDYKEQLSEILEDKYQ